MYDPKDFRPNVAAIILNSNNKILAGRRPKGAKGWQIPQGGIDPGETPEEALHREVMEETRLNGLEIIARTPDWIYYVWPPEFKKPKYLGQRQIYFLCRLGRPLQPQPTKEFVEFDWLEWKQIMDLAHPMRHSPYKQAFDQLKNYFPSL